MASLGLLMITVSALVCAPADAGEPIGESTSATGTEGAAEVAVVEESKPTIVVLDLIAERGIDAGTVRLLNELLLTEFARTGRFDVVGGSDLKALAEHDVRMQTMGCTEAACLAEFAGALGANLLAVANVGPVGEFFLINVKIIDVDTKSVTSRWTAQVEGNETRLIAAVKECVAAVTGAPSPPDPRGSNQTAPSLRAEAEPWLLAEVGFVTLALGGVAVMALATGVGFGVTTKGHYDNSRDAEYVGRQAAIEDGKQTQVVANVVFAVSAAAAVAGVVVWLGRDSSGSVMVAPNPAGHGMAALVRFEL